MTIHFAAARTPSRSPLARAFARRTIARAANDNGNEALLKRNDEVLQAALRHFAKHGLAAAKEARQNAEQAFFDGDSEGYKWWLEICKMLDRRLADESMRHSRG